MLSRALVNIEQPNKPLKGGWGRCCWRDQHSRGFKQRYWEIQQSVLNLSRYMNKRNQGSSTTSLSYAENLPPNSSSTQSTKPQRSNSTKTHSKSNSLLFKDSKNKNFGAELKPKPQKLLARNPHEFSYYQDIITFIRDLEKKQQQSRNLSLSDASFRRRLNYLYRDQSISYLFEMGARHSYKRETIHLATSIYDRYSLVYSASDEMQIREIIVACLFIAGKYTQYIPPPLKRIKTQIYSDDIIRREGEILLALNFNLTKYTALQHFDYLAELYCLSHTEAQLARLILDITLYNHKICSKSRPQFLAVAVVYVLTQLLEVNFPWGQCFFDKRSVQTCAKEITKGFKQDYPKHHRVVQKLNPKIKGNPYLARI